MDLDNISKKTIFVLFATLLFFVPLVLWPFTSEVFEFNKIVLLYAFTVLIMAAWLTRSVLVKKIIFRRTISDIPLLIFLTSQLISTFLSIDFYTSVFGYYSRFNGGFLSTICYCLLYWAFVSNLDRKQTLFTVYCLLSSAVLVSIYGVLEHFGIDKNIWVQDVQSRVFSTLGQPNWLAAYLVALLPIIYNLKFTIHNKFSIINYSISILFFATLLFTKSRSGLLGFALANIIYWSLVLYKDFKNNIKPFVIHNSLFIVLALLIGTQFTPNLKNIIEKQSTVTSQQSAAAPSGTALETGGTESGTIRKIVWQGAIDIWKHYPIFGTGVETYAFSYYLFRPVAHNLTSEWDFIYNKAHNEFLNYAANTGTVGILSYLGVIIFSIIQISNYLIILISKKAPTSQFKNSENYLGQLDQLEISTLRVALLAGFISLSVSNFFGFSVVPTQLEFFLFPAIGIVISNQSLVISKNNERINSVQKVAIFFILLTTCYSLLTTYRYWNADILYAKGKAQNEVQRPDLAFPILNEAIRLEPNQAIYYGEVATSYANIAMAFDQVGKSTDSANFTNLTVTTIQKAINLAPANINLRRLMFGVYVRLSTTDEKYLVVARDSLLETIKIAPTDPKLYFNLGIANANLGKIEDALSNFKKSIELKDNYSDARVQYAALLVHLKRFDEAKAQLTYVLTNIDPKNDVARRALDELK
jgi:O-antigen ligase